MTTPYELRAKSVSIFKHTVLMYVLPIGEFNILFTLHIHRTSLSEQQGNCILFHTPESFLIVNIDCYAITISEMEENKQK